MGNHAMTREKFLATPTKLSWDGLPHNPNADKNCNTCGGHGIVDAGGDYGCMLVDCPTCWTSPTSKGGR